MHVSPVRGERGGWGLGRGDVGANVVLEAIGLAGGDGEWQGTRRAAANVGQSVGDLIASKADVPGDPAEEDGLVMGRISIFEREDLCDQVLEFDREGNPIKQVRNKLRITEDVDGGAGQGGPGVQQEGEGHADRPEFREVVGANLALGA